MKTQLLVIMAILAGFFAAEPALCQEDGEVDESAGKDCFNIRRINGWSYIDERHILVRATGSEQYLLTLKSNCRAIRNANAIALSNTMGRLCPNDFGRVTYRDMGMSKSCLIDNVEAVAGKDEAEALVESRKSED